MGDKKMRKLNNHGFAVSIVLYASATIIVLVLVIILSVLSSTNKGTLDLSDMVKEEVSGVTGMTYQLHNLVSNGSFENDSTSWTTDLLTINNTVQNRIDTTDFHSGSKSLYINPNGFQYQRLSGDLETGDKLYLGSYQYIKNLENTGLQVSIIYNGQKETGGNLATIVSSTEGTYDTNHTTNGFERYGVIVTVPTELELFVKVASVSNQEVTGYVDDVFVVNLTKTFGAGKEPTLNWCNSNLKYFNSVTTLTIYDSDE